MRWKINQDMMPTFPWNLEKNLLFHFYKCIILHKNFDLKRRIISGFFNFFALFSKHLSHCVGNKTTPNNGSAFCFITKVYVRGH